MVRKITKYNLLAVMVLLTLSVVGILGVNNVTGEYSITPSVKDDGVYQEMLPGVFVNTYWNNESEVYNETWTYDVVSGVGANGPEGSLEPVLNDTSPIWDPYLIEIIDKDGNFYYIIINTSNSWSGSWDITELKVDILIDSDKSVLNYLSDHPNSGIYEVSLDLFTGDEAFYSSDFYMFNWEYSYSIGETYTWVDQDGYVVDPAEVIPVLAEEYSWAEMYAQDFEYEDHGSYSMFGFSVYQLTLLNLTQDTLSTFEIEHFFEGFSIFNDTNNNGIIDLDYGSYSYYEDDLINASFIDYEVDQSELEYSVWILNGTLESINVPEVIDDQIVWNVMYSDVYAEIWSTESSIWDVDPSMVFINDSDILEPAAPDIVLIDEIAFDFRFLIEGDEALLKIDQKVSDFVDPSTGAIPTYFEGLSLTINYWSSVMEYSEEQYNYSLLSEDPADNISAEALYYSSDPWNDSIDFEIVSEDLSFDLTPVSIEFGGQYLWSKDNKDYDVNTVMVPMFAFYSDIYHQSGVNDLFGISSTVKYGSYYYSSCYVNWDGYAIVHDPAYSAVIIQRADNDTHTTGLSSDQTSPVPGFELVYTLSTIIVSIAGMKVKKRK